MLKASDFEIEPDLGAADAEPSLGEIIYRYYQPHYGSTGAVGYTEAYMAALLAPGEDSAGEIIADLMERMDWMGTGSSESGEAERREFEERITALGLTVAER